MEMPPSPYHTRVPEWGAVEITQAMLDLLEEALRIGNSSNGKSKSNRHNNNNNNNNNNNSQDDERYSSKRYISANEPKKSFSIPQTTPTVDRFLFASETCMPVSTLAELELALFGNHVPLKSTLSNHHHQKSSATANTYPDADKSWINARNTPNNGHARQLQWDPMHTAVPKVCIWKADQWIILTWHHAWPILSLIDEAVQRTTAAMERRGNNNHHHQRHHPRGEIGGGGGGGNASATTWSSSSSLALWHCFRDVRASDEMYFPTVMALLGILSPPAAATSTTPSPQSCGDEVASRRVTYCDWSAKAKNPEAFSVARLDDFREFRKVVELAREEGCLFARNFSGCANGGARGGVSNHRAAASSTIDRVSEVVATIGGKVAPTTSDGSNSNDDDGKGVPAGEGGEKAKNEVKKDEKKKKPTVITGEEWFDIISNASAYQI